MDHIAKFVEEHEEEIEERAAQLEAGDAKDAYLLILSPAREVGFYGKARQDLLELVERFSVKESGLSEDYYKVLAYYSLANHPDNNFTFRKVLHYEGVSQDIVSALIHECLETENGFAHLDNDVISGLPLRGVRSLRRFLTQRRLLRRKFGRL